MIKQIIRKQKKMVKGIIYTYLKPKREKYNASEYWDKSFYSDGVSDRQTILANKSPISAKYHYSSIELKILKHLYNNGVDINGTSVLDVGSGSGYWIAFYKAMGAGEVTGIDVSESSIEFLKDKYANDEKVLLYHGKASELIGGMSKKMDIVNAIGVMFHIVDDEEWRETIEKIADRLPTGGIFVVGGHFGILNGLNVQIKGGQINKRLRSRSVWKKTLKKAGFSKVNVYNNYAYLWINDRLPENSILIATK